MPHPTPVPSEIVRKLQEIVDLTAEIMHVPSALIMRVCSSKCRIPVQELIRRTSIVPILLHDQTRWDGHGTGDQPLDRRGAWRAAIGNTERARRRGLSVHAAGGGTALPTGIDRSRYAATGSLPKVQPIHTQV